MKQQLIVLAAAALAVSGTSVSAGTATDMSTAAAATYYVDCSGASDGDGSSSAPWNTLTSVNDATFGSGDEILFKAGTSCDGILEPQGSGAENAPIVIDSYGVGDRPVINGGGGLAAVQLTDQSWWTIQGLEVTNHAADRARRNGILVDFTGGQHAGITIRDNVVDGVAGWGNKATDGRSFALSAGIVVMSSSSSGGTVDGITITGNTVRNSGGGGIKISNDPGTGYAGRHSDVYVAFNTIDAVGGDGIVIHRSSDPLIEHNTARDLGLGEYPYEDGNFAGMWAIGSDNPVFQYNSVVNSHPSVFDSQAWDCDGGIGGTCTFQYNYSAGNAGGFFLSCLDCTAWGTTNADIVLRYNVSQDECVIPRREDKTMHVYNNTFWCTSLPLDMAFGSGAEVRNNVFVASSGTFDVAPGAVFEANTYAGGLDARADDPSAHTGMPGLVAGGTGQTDAASADGYQAEVGAPVIGTGVQVADQGGRGFFGNPIGTDVNRGAYAGPGEQPMGVVSFNQASNIVTISPDENPNVGGLSTSGRSYSMEAMAAAGMVLGGTVQADGVTYEWPSRVGGPDAVVPNGQTIELTGRGSQLGFLGAGAYGDQSADVTIAYADGTTASATVTFDDWWHTTSDTGGTRVLLTDYHHTQQSDHRDVGSAVSTVDVSVWATSIPVNPDKTVVSVTLGDTSSDPLAGPGLRIFDIALH